MKSSGCSKYYLPVLVIFVLAIVGSSMFSTVFATMNTTFLRVNSSLEEERNTSRKRFGCVGQKSH